MPNSAETQQSVQQPAEQSPVPQSSVPEFWFVATCLVVPVLWGVIVHRVFRRLQSRPKPADNDSVWPDFQI
ncbi:hypothetical protein [Fuerstiella marisgermanici]|uniref:hypothetical protein n=1 Tax=Fuerstiella marisgermanici TaxID=1891926 RepID=UPI00097C0171|nr:hypothetical protein [Fuerstiella marisgermanici]